MRLSEAINLGRSMVSGFTDLFFYRPETNCACARGMASLAVGETLDFDGGKNWPWIREPEFSQPCPVCGHTCDTAAFVINHLMNHVVAEECSMDALIEWVRSVEPAESETSILAEPASVEEMAIKHAE